MFKLNLKFLLFSDLTRGTTFELTSSVSAGIEEEEGNMFWGEDEDPDRFKNPCDNSSFDELKSAMTEISEGIFKQVQKPPAEDAKEVDMKRHRITYHRNMYLEGEDHPFDSTHLNGKADEVCLPLKKDEYLDGFLEALASMKEGEQSLFVISYKKMFKELGCPPRVSFPTARECVTLMNKIILDSAKSRYSLRFESFEGAGSRRSGNYRQA